MNKTMKKENIRRRLLSTVSAVVLLVAGADQALAASDADRPSVWLEFGWHYEHVNQLGDILDPPFAEAVSQAGFASPLGVQRRMSASYGGEGKISFQPDDSNWLFTAALRYGRAHSSQHVHEQGPNDPLYFTFGGNVFPNPLPPAAVNFSDAVGGNSETHVIADFQVGRDFGLGTSDAVSSQLNFGVRFANLKSHSTIRMDAIPDYEAQLNLAEYKYHHRYMATKDDERGFRGLGPEISWNGSASLLGNREDGEVTFDWGANAALLFGRQRTKVHHQSSNVFYKSKYLHFASQVITTRDDTGPINRTRSRSVTVPNVGGTLGLSVRYPNVRLSVGYRGDFFIGAIDGGIDTRHSISRGFSGPFASLSIGLGD